MSYDLRDKKTFFGKVQGKMSKKIFFRLNLHRIYVNNNMKIVIHVIIYLIANIIITPQIIHTKNKGEIRMYSKLPSWNIRNKRIFLRADLNVPLENKKIINDFRLQSLLPTIDYILEHEGTIILATHIGRPQKHDPNLSTEILLPWFKKNGYSIVFEKNLDNAYQKSKTANKQIILLENIRFFPAEKKNDSAFAQQLAQLGDFYVNDAFGTLHRADTSITLAAQEFAPEKRTIGLLIEKELKILNNLLHNPKKPFVLILGGGKITDKIPIIQNFLDKVETILLCPAIVFTFLKAIGRPVGNSLVDNQMLETCKTILKQTEQQNVSVMFPVDFQVAEGNIDGPLAIESANSITTNDIGISIGPETIQVWKTIIKEAGTVFLNGSIGFANKPETLNGMKTILHAMAQSTGTTIVAGGDSVAMTHSLGFANQIDYLSTGGGATLAYLSGQELPGLTIINHK